MFVAVAIVFPLVLLLAVLAMEQVERRLTATRAVDDLAAADHEASGLTGRQA